MLLHAGHSMACVGLLSHNIHSKNMNKIKFFLWGVLFISGVSFIRPQDRTLPVLIAFSDSAKMSKDLVFYFKAAFLSKKIKTLSKAETLELIDSETRSVMQPYAERFKATNGSYNFEESKRYMADNMRNVANSLYIKMKIDEDGFLNDTVKWQSYTLPVNLVNFPRPKWHQMILDSKNASTPLQMCQSIVDSIIASNVLAKD